MKDNITDQLKGVVDSTRRWISLEIEYAKLTATEKITILLSTLILGAVCMLLGMVILILFSFSLVDLFKTFLHPVLAYLCVGGILALLIALIIILRRPLLENPISRLISKLILEIKPRDNEQKYK
ncbi:MAG: phage holin family protein [Muribaculaceae bacterium]